MNPGEATVLAIAVPVAEVSHLAESIDINVPAEITIADPQNDKQTISVKVSASKKLQARLTYSRKTDLSDAVKYKHRIELPSDYRKKLEQGEPVVGGLHSIIRVKDMSGSDAAWSKTCFFVNDGFPLKCTFSMQPGESAFAPIGVLWDYQIQMKFLGQHQMEIREGVAYRLAELSNTRTQPDKRIQRLIPAGVLDVNLNKRLHYSAHIEQSIKPGDHARLLEKPVPASEVIVKAKPPAELWQSYVSLDDAILKTQPNNAKQADVRNLLESPIRISFKGDTNTTTIASKIGKSVDY